MIRAGGMQDAAMVSSVADAPILRTLFPRPVGAAEVRGEAAVDTPWPAEAQAVERAVASRVREFAAGRACARSAMVQLGRAPVAVPAGSDRAPDWPAGLVGSITHTKGYCASVVALASLYAGIGLDVERVGAVGSDLWPRLYTPWELAWLERQPVAMRDEAATLLFCAKEAFYKSQYPTTGRWLEFDDVEVELEVEARASADQPGVGTYTIRVGRHVVPAGFPASGRGRYCRDAGLLLASAWLDLPTGAA